MSKKLFLFATPLMISPLTLVAACSQSNQNQSSNTYPNDLLNPEGGFIDGLKVDQYLNLVKTLNLTKQTNLLDLSNENLSAKLQAKTQDQSNVEIENGSTFNHLLNLKINLLNKSIIKIKIEGFDYYVPEGLQYKNVDFDSQKWKDDGQPILTSPNLSDIDKIDEKLWITYIKDFAIFDQNGQNLGTYKNWLNHGFDFTIKGQLVVDQLQFRIQVNWLYFVYDSNQQKWIKDLKHPNSIAQIDIPSTTTSLPN